MLRALRLAALAAGAWCTAASGCGRLGFNDAPRPDDGGPPGPIDAPPIPDSICQVDRIPIASLPANADLAITGTPEGYAALWLDPSGNRPAHGVLLAPNRALRASIDLPQVKDTRVGGLIDIGQKLALSTGNGVSLTPWIVGRDLATTSPGSALADTVMAHDPYPSDSAQSPRVFVTAAGTMLMAAYIANDGTINNASTVSRGTSDKVTELACADGPNHAHCAWAEAVVSAGGDAQCTASDVTLQPVPSIPGGPIVSSDCHEVRTSSGPDAADSMIVVWTTSDHRVQARYVGSGGLDILQPVAQAGSAPRVQFDGFRFWIAWLDDHDVLQLASFEQSGKILYYPLPGWDPIGKQAFELVRRQNSTALALLSPAGLEILTMCGSNL